MIVHVNVRADAPPHRALANIHPTHQLSGTVHNDLVPDFRLLLNSLSIAQEPDRTDFLYQGE